VEGLRCSYGRKPVLSIERLDLRQGEVTALIGANGAGKSTLVSCLCGIKPHRGRVSLEGKVLSRRRRLDMSYMVMQDVNHQLFTESVREELLLAGSRAKDAKRNGPPAEGDNEARVDRLLARLDLSACAEKHPMALSGGQKQRVAIAAALNAGKRLLFLDEPTSGLDHAGMHRLCELIGDLNEDVFTTVVITHDLELIMGCCTSVLRLEDGAIVEHYLLDENGRNRLLEWGNEMTQRDKQDKTTPRTATAPPEATSVPPLPATTPATAPPAPPEAAPEPPPKPPGFGRLLQFALIRKGYSLSSVVLAALAAICGFVPFIAIYLLIAQLAVLYPDFSAADPAALMRYGWLALGGIVANIVLYFAALCLSHIAAFGTLYQLKLDFTSHLAKVPLGFFLQTGTGRLRKIMDDNIEKIEGFIAHQLPDIVAGVTAPVVMLVILFAVDWRFGLASLLGIVIAFAIEMKAYGGGAVQEMAQKYQHTLEEMSNATVEYVRGISVVKAFRQTTYSFTRLRETIRAYTSFVIPYTLNWESPMSAFIVIVNNIYLFVVPLGIIVGMFTPASEMATFVAHFLFYLVFVPCIANVMMKLLYVSTNAVQISSGVAAMDRVLAYPALPEPERPAPVPISHDIVFEDVRFSYAEDADKAAPAAREADKAAPAARDADDVEGVRDVDDVEGARDVDDAEGARDVDDAEGARDARGRTATEALKGVSFTARQGEVTALVGPSGSGKTTIAHLICRFFDVDDGRVLLGGTDVRALSTEQLMEQVSFVFQDVFLFRQSVRDNIRMARLGASDEEVIAAAKAAQCHEFIERLPQGYDTVIGAAGVHLSGGERQRIALARAIIKDAPVVVLDEATAFADPENEHLIQRAFERLMRGKTVVLIAHRLSTVTGADRILVVDGGRIVEQGRHAELLATRGKYAEMWKSYERAVSWTMGQSVAETVAGREHSHA
jgi:ATP-binding cassette subfamily B protein